MSTTFLGGSELERSDAPGCNVAFDMTLDHTQYPRLSNSPPEDLYLPGTLSTVISFPQRVLSSQVLKVTPYPSQVNGFFLFPSYSGASAMGFLTMSIWDVVWFGVGKNDATESFTRISSI